MKLVVSAFQSDVLTLTWSDLARLAMGRALKCGPLIIRRCNKEHDEILRYMTEKANGQ